MSNFAAPPNPMRQRTDDAPANTNHRYRGLASQLLADASQLKGGYGVGVTSSSHGEGVTNTITNLAVTAAGLSESPILLVELANGNSGLAPFLGVRADNVADNLSEHRSPLDEVVQPTNYANLSFLAAEINHPQHDVNGWSSLLAEAKQAFGLVLLDLPPIAELSSQTASFGSVDGVLMVVEAGRSRQKAVLRATSLLQRMGLRPLGVVLNKRKTFVPDWLYNKV